MNRQKKIDFLNRFREGRASTEELDPFTMVVKDKIGSTYRNVRTGRLYKCSDLEHLKKLNIVIIMIENDELDL